MSATVIGALRRFLPAFRDTGPPLSAVQRRALRALSHCRTPALGGRAFGCKQCGRHHFAFHSCRVKGFASRGSFTQRMIGKVMR